MEASLHHKQQSKDQKRDTNYEDLTEDLDRARENDYLDMMCNLKTELAQKSDECEILKIKLSDSTRDNESLRQELNHCKLTIFESIEDGRKTHEEMTKSKKLEEDYVKLMSDFLELNERCERYRFSLNDKYLEKSNAINNYECLLASGALQNELVEFKSVVQSKTSDLNLASSKIRHLEEELAIKDRCITELRKTLDDAKITHKHEINVLDEYIQCLKNTISSYEKTLADYAAPQEDSPTIASEKQSIAQDESRAM